MSVEDQIALVRSRAMLLIERDVKSFKEDLDILKTRNAAKGYFKSGQTLKDAAELVTELLRVRSAQLLILIDEQSYADGYPEEELVDLAAEIVDLTPSSIVGLLEKLYQQVGSEAGAARIRSDISENVKLIREDTVLSLRSRSLNISTSAKTKVSKSFLVPLFVALAGTIIGGLFLAYYA